MGIELPIAGFIVGLLVGITGMGGALIMTPIMIFVFGINPAVAVGSDLIYASITKIFGAFQHWRQKTIDFVVVKWLSTGSKLTTTIPDMAVRTALMLMLFLSGMKLLN